MCSRARYALASVGPRGSLRLGSVVGGDGVMDILG